MITLSNNVRISNLKKIVKKNHKKRRIEHCIQNTKSGIIALQYILSKNSHESLEMS